jgi:hypothetical protein
MTVYLVTMSLGRTLFFATLAIAIFLVAFHGVIHHLVRVRQCGSVPAPVRQCAVAIPVDAEAHHSQAVPARGANGSSVLEHRESRSTVPAGEPRSPKPRAVGPGGSQLVPREPDRPSGVTAAGRSRHPRPRAHDALRQMRARLGQQIVLRLSTLAEILIAIDNALRQDAAMESAWRTGRAAAGSPPCVPDQVHALAADEELYLGPALVEAELLVRTSPRGGGPRVQTSQHRAGAAPAAPRPGGPLDLATLRALRVVPLSSNQTGIFLADDTPPTIETMETAQTALELTLHPVLVRPTDIIEPLA